MLHLILIFLGIAFLASVFGNESLYKAAALTAQVLFLVFLVVLLVTVGMRKLRKKD
jgi:uncharacterized membrane protein YtjA (UPF0391 family)